MFRLVRTAISLVFVALVLWFAFTVKLGKKSLAEHMDAIGGTKEAQELFDGARKTVNPALEEAKERIIGEYVEAPTHIAPSPANADGTSVSATAASVNPPTRASDGSSAPVPTSVP